MLHEVINSNMTVLFCGMSLITIYVIVMLSRCNAMQQRIYLSLMGISVVGQAFLSSYGVCYYMGFFYGPVHPILPFLLLGIGVDDMFIIMQSLETTSETEKSLDIPTRIAKSIQVSGAIKFFNKFKVKEDRNNSRYIVYKCILNIFRKLGEYNRIKIRKVYTIVY